MICAHGQLARQCELCDKDREIERLRAASLRLLDALDRLDHGSREPGFRGWCCKSTTCGARTTRDAIQRAALGGAWRDCLTAPAAARISESQSTPSTEVRRGPWRYRGNFGRQIRRAVVRCAEVLFP